MSGVRRIGGHPARQALWAAAFALTGLCANPVQAEPAVDSVASASAGAAPSIYALDTLAPVEPAASAEAERGVFPSDARVHPFRHLRQRQTYPPRSTLMARKMRLPRPARAVLTLR